MPQSILVADDDREMRKLYARIFKDSGYLITMASTFSEASGFIAANHYDLLVTGSGSAGGILECAGIDDYFHKPFKVEDFLAAVVKRLAD